MLTILFAHHKVSLQEKHLLGILERSNPTAKIVKIGFAGNKLFDGSIEIEYPHFAPQEKNAEWEWRNCDYIAYEYGFLYADPEDTIVFLESDCCCDIDLSVLEKHNWGKIGDDKHPQARYPTCKNIIGKIFQHRHHCAPVNGVFAKGKFLKQGKELILKYPELHTCYCEGRIGLILRNTAGKPFVLKGKNILNSPWESHITKFGKKGHFLHRALL